jgi:hypothetical protein
MKKAQATTQYTVNIENKMMKDRRLISATDPIRSLQTLQLKGGGQNLYGNGPIFEKPLLRRYYLDPGSLSGWSRQDIWLPGYSMVSYTIGYEADGTPRLFVMTQDDDTTTNATIYEVKLAADGSPGDHVRITAATSPAVSTGMCFSSLGPSLTWHDDTFQQLLGMWGENLDQPFTPHDTINSFELYVNQNASILSVPDPSGLTTWPNIKQLMQNLDGGLMVVHGLNFDAPNQPGLLCDAAYLPAITDNNGQPVSANTYSVTGFADGRRSIFATIGDGQIRTLSGTADPSTGIITWVTAWSILDIGVPQLTSDFSVHTGQRADGSTTIAFVDGNRSLWISELGSAAGSTWSQADMISQLQDWSGNSFIDDEGDFGFTFIDQNNFIHTLIRDDGEGWDAQLVDTEDGTTLDTVDVYRVGLMIVDDTQAAAVGKSVTISTSDEVAAFVNGDPYYFSTDNSWTGMTDSNGAIWIMVDILNSIGVPTFNFSSADGIFDGKTIIVMPDAKAQTFTTGVDAATLQSATDDTGQLLLPSTAPFADIASNLNKLGSAIAHIYAPQEYRSDKLYLPAYPGARVYDRVSDAVYKPKTELMGNWSMKTVNGVLTFEQHTVESAAARRQEMIERVAAERGVDIYAPDFDPNSFWDDWDDAFDWIADELVSVGEAVISAAEATISFIVDGVSRLVTAALDGLEAVVDCVVAVLNFAGAILGRVVGWLIRAIGWLLGLPDMVAIKNMIKGMMVDSIASLGTTLPDPSGFITPFIQDLQTWQGELSSIIQSFETTPGGSQSNSDIFGGISSLVSAMSAGPASVASEATWLIEKLLSALPRMDGGLSAGPDYGVSGTITDLLAKAENMQGSMNTFIGDLVAGGLESWYNSLASFDGANIDPVLTAIDNNATQLFQDAEGVVGDVGTIMHALWSNPTAVTDWLDQPLDIPFFSAFYAGLIGNDLSILDFVALAAALPYSVIGPSLDSEDDDDGYDAKLYTIFSLMLVRALLKGVSAGYQQPQGTAPSTSPVAVLSQYALMALNGMISTLVLDFSVVNKKNHWYAPAVVDLTMTGFNLLVTWAAAQQGGFRYAAAINDGIGIAGGVIAFIVNTSVLGFNNKTFGYLALRVAADGLHFAVDQKCIEVQDPEARAAYVIIEGGLSATQSVMFLLDNRQSEAKPIAAYSVAAVS